MWDQHFLDDTEIIGNFMKFRLWPFNIFLALSFIDASSVQPLHFSLYAFMFSGQETSEKCLSIVLMAWNSSGSSFLRRGLVDQ